MRILGSSRIVRSCSLAAVCMYADCIHAQLPAAGGGQPISLATPPVAALPSISIPATPPIAQTTPIPVQAPSPTAAVPAARSEPQEPPKQEPTIPAPEISTPPAAQTNTPLPVEQEKKLSPERIGSSGNWLKKREWLIATQEVVDQISKTALEIEKFRLQFDEKEKQLSNAVAVFYKKNGFDQGKTQELFASIQRHLEKRKRQELEAQANKGPQDLDARLRLEQIEQNINELQKQLEQFKLDAQSITDLANSLQDRRAKLDQQIAQAQKIAGDARIVVQEMWYIIDDKIARSDYYKTKDGTAAQMQSIKQYLNQQLMPDVDRLIKSVTEQASKVEQSIAALESKGLIIKDRAARVQELKQKNAETAQKTAQAEQQKMREELARKKAELEAEQNTWYHQVGIVVNRVASVINRWVTRTIRWINDVKVLIWPTEETSSPSTAPSTPSAPVRPPSTSSSDSPATTQTPAAPPLQSAPQPITNAPATTTAPAPAPIGVIPLPPLTPPQTETALVPPPRGP